jgi:glutamate synthase domain-containing protein 3
MRHSVVHALVDHQGEIQKQVEAEIKDLVTNGHLENQIKESVRRHLDTAINEAVKHAMSSWTRESPTVKQAIQSAVADALWRTESAQN